MAANSTTSKATRRMQRFRVNGEEFCVDPHYKLKRCLGKGAYGMVASAEDSRRNRKVAIKKCINAFADVVDAKRILREIKFLAHFDHPNIIQLCDMVPPRGRAKGEFDDVYMILEHMESDLHKIIYSHNVLSDQHCQYFMYQILKALKCIHSASVVHRDLKPANLLINGNCELKICDFGLARADNSVFELTEYVVTRWYRAPEIMCSCQDYTDKVDVWSTGCILAELLQRKPLWPGRHYVDQLSLIFKLLGTPKADDMKWISNEKALTYIVGLKKVAPVPFRRHFKDATPGALDLLEKMLVFNPNKRITVDEALAHPWLKNFADKDKDSKVKDICKKGKFNSDWEVGAQTEDNVRSLMYREALVVREDCDARHRKSMAPNGQKSGDTEEVTTKMKSTQL